jgi:hypothetical protein
MQSNRISKPIPVYYLKHGFAKRSESLFSDTELLTNFQHFNDEMRLLSIKQEAFDEICSIFTKPHLINTFGHKLKDVPNRTKNPLFKNFERESAIYSKLMD